MKCSVDKELKYLFKIEELTERVAITNYMKRHLTNLFFKTYFFFSVKISVYTFHFLLLYFYHYVFVTI